MIITYTFVEKETLFQKTTAVVPTYFYKTEVK